jgi:hypothetical protein
MKLHHGLLGTFFCLCLALANPANAAETTKEMRAALQALSQSQRFDQTLGPMLDNIRANGVTEIREGARESLSKDPRLSAEDRTRVIQIVDELAPQMAARMDAEFKKIDLSSLGTAMIEEVYPRYFNAEEIRELARFYASPAFHKTALFGLEVDRVHAETGQDKSVLWSRFEKQLSPEEKRRIIVFYGSPLGRKLKELSPSIVSDSGDFWRRRTAPVFETIAASYRDVIAARWANSRLP